METESSAPLYRVWGVDNVAYGPVELPALVSWIKAERVLRDSWIFDHAGAKWCKAAEIPELSSLFSRRPAPHRQDALPTDSIPPGCLRRIKILSGMDDAQLQSFANYMEAQQFKQFAT